MRVVSREELRQLPPGTLFTYYDGMAVCKGLHQLGPSSGGDFYIRSLLPEVDVSVAADQFKPELDCSWCREGLFDDGMKYVVWEQHDLAVLAHKLFLAIREMGPGMKWLVDHAAIRLLDQGESSFPGGD